MRRRNFDWGIRLLTSAATKPKLQIFARYWLPVLVWMAVIFSASSDRHSFSHSSRLIGPVIKWLFPKISEQALYNAIFAVRKCAHLTEYAILGLLIWRALRKPLANGPPRPWAWAHARLTLLIVLLYAATDEFHQIFVPSRQGTVEDVLIDTSGATLALAGLWITGRWRRRW